MTARFVSRPRIAEALGLQRAAVQKLVNAGRFPAPDCVLEETGGRESYGWLPETGEAWAVEQGREISWEVS